MSRALLLIAQSRFLKRPLTAEETTACLLVWADLCGGERVYVPAKLPTDSERTEEIANLLEWGMSIRAIARELGCDRREVREVARVGGSPAFSAPTP